MAVQRADDHHVQLDRRSGARGHGLRHGRQPGQLRRLDADICASRRCPTARPTPTCLSTTSSARSSCCCGRTAGSTSCTVRPTSPASPRRRPRPPGPGPATAAGEPPSSGGDGPARRRALRLRARAAPGRHRPGRRCRRGRPRRVRGPLVAGAAILKPGKAGEIPGWPTPSCSPRRPASGCYAQVAEDRRSPGRWSSSSPTSATGSGCTWRTSRRCAGRSRCSTSRRSTSSPTGSRSTASGSPGSRCGRATGSPPASRRRPSSPR